MSGHKTNLKPGTKPLRNASEPFAIDLDGDAYILSRSALNANIEATLKRNKEWLSPKLWFLSFKDRTLRFRNVWKRKSFEMSVYIEPDRLRFSCSCGALVKSLCIHTYKALDRLLWKETTNYFEKFKEGSVAQIASVHRKYFVGHRTDIGIDFILKKNLGMAYLLTDKLNYNLLSTALQLRVQNEAVYNTYQPKLTAVAYMLMDSTFDRYLPFPLPCIGVLNNDGTHIKGFYPYLNQEIAEKGPEGLNDKERILNKKCFEMQSLVEENPGSILTYQGEANPICLPLFTLWQETWPFLAKQEHVFLDNFYGKRHLKEKPAIRRVKRIRVMTEVPRLYFQLIDKGVFYHFLLKISVNGKISIITSAALLSSLAIMTGFIFWDQLETLQ